jgi:hypothetical protein
LKEMMRQLMNNSNNSSRHTPVTSTEKREHDAKTPSTNPEDKEMPSPDHRKQRQTNALDMDPPSTTVPLAINFEEVTEDINMDTGGSDTAPSVNSMFSAETPTVVEEELSITGHNFNNNMDCTSSPIPTTITATNQSNGECTPALNGSPNRQTSLERRNTTTTANNRYSALQTTSTTKESNNNNNNNTNPSAKDRQDRKND